MLLINIASLVIIVGHITITYLWVTNWQVLEQPFVRLLWIISTIIGFLICTMNKRHRFLQRNILFITSMLMILLAVLAILAIIITNSMP